jgi:hypothetical protein
MNKLYEMRVTLTEHGFDKEINDFKIIDYCESDMFVSVIGSPFKARIPFSELDKINENNFENAYPFAEVITLNQEKLDDYYKRTKKRIIAHLVMEKIWIERLLEVGK